MNKKILLPVIAIAILFTGCGKVVNTNKTPKSDLDSFSYAFGLLVANQLKGSGIKKMDYSSFLHGFEDGINKDSGFAIPANKVETILESFSKKEMKKMVKIAQEENKKFMQEKEKEGYKSLPAGSLFKLSRKGMGKLAGEYDTLAFRLTVKDKKGKVISDGANMPPSVRAVYQLRNGFPDFYEALQQSPEGSVFTLVTENERVPMLNQGSRGIDAYNISIMTVEILKVTPGTKPKDEPKAKLSPEEQLQQQIQEQMQQQGQGGN